MNPKESKGIIGDQEINDLNVQPVRTGLFAALMALPFVGIVMLAVISMGLYNPTLNNPFIFSVQNFGTAILVAGSAYIVGWFVGFLFGLPRYLTSPDNINKSLYSRNDNLIQVSDWLTKIIVGLGLTNLYKIPPKLTALGIVLAPIFGMISTAAVLSEVLVIYFLVSGFLYGYLWTNIQYIPILTEMDVETEKIKELVPKLKSAVKFIKAIRTGDVQTSDAVAHETINRLRGSVKDQENFVTDDPQKNQWGKQSETNNKKVSAIVNETWFKSWFEVCLKVESTDKQKPLIGEVTFHLHPTFSPDIRSVKVVDGIAEIKLFAYGAFTVGVLVKEDQTRLELDLADLTDAPSLFRSR